MEIGRDGGSMKLPSDLSLRVYVKNTSTPRKVEHHLESHEKRELSARALNTSEYDPLAPCAYAR